MPASRSAPVRVRGAGLVVAILLCAPAVAGGSPDAEHTVRAPTEFTDGELAAALAARDTSGEVRRRCKATAPAPDSGRVTVRCAGRARLVELGSRTGMMAARLVAMVALDLVFPEAAALPVSAPAHAMTSQPPDSRPLAIRARLLPGARRGVSSTDAPTLAVEADLAVARDGLEIRVGLGWWRTEEEPTLLSAAMSALPVRAGGAIRLAAVELSASAVAAPYRFGYPISITGVLWGGGIGARAVTQVASGLELSVGGGVDLFANRIAIDLEGETVFSTPRLCVSGSVGVGWSWEAP